MDYLPVDHFIQQEQVIYVAVAKTDTVLSCGDLLTLSKQLGQGNTLLSNKDYKKAIALFNEGIQTIGDRYYASGLQDDTGTKLLLANAEEKNSNLERAAYLKRSVFESRLTELKNRSQCNIPSEQREAAQYIGEAWMEDNHEIVMRLFAQESDISGQALFRYKPDDPQYKNILIHLNGLKPGERKGVLPWDNK